jgi:tetratricopeptide (TPR) repeat protein
MEDGSMNESPEMAAFKTIYRQYVEESKDVSAWQFLESSAIFRKHTGDIDGAIDAMVKAISLTRTVPNLAERTAINLNYLADLYLLKDANDEAEEALRESIALARPRDPGLLADDLWILAGIQSQKGEHREALASAEEARQLYQQQGHSYGVAQAEERIERIRTNLE